MELAVWLPRLDSGGWGVDRYLELALAFLSRASALTADA
jgi:hypothetical protein